MSLPLIILAIFSIFFGFLTKDIFTGLGSDFFSDNSLFIHPSHEIMLNTEFFVPVLFKLLPLFFTLSLTCLSILFTEFYPKLLINFKFSILGYNIFSFFNQRFAVELFYNKYISGVILKMGGQTSKDMDKGIVETFGPFGLQKKFTEISKSINKLSTGVVTNYALYILIGLLFFLNIPFFSLFIDINYLLIIIFTNLLFILPDYKTAKNIKRAGLFEMYELFNNLQTLLPAFKANYEAFASNDSFTEANITEAITERNRLIDVAYRYYSELYSSVGKGNINECKTVARGLSETDEAKSLDSLRFDYSRLFSGKKASNLDSKILQQLIKTTHEQGENHSDLVKEISALKFKVNQSARNNGVDKAEFKRIMEELYYNKVGLLDRKDTMDAIIKKNPKGV